MLMLNGVGKAKLEKYGEAFLGAIRTLADLTPARGNVGH
jgi:hypothetical protein